MLSMSVDGINFIGKFEHKYLIFNLARRHNIFEIYIGEFKGIPEDSIQKDRNFYTYLEMDHKVRVILRNCVWNRIPGVIEKFQQELVEEFDKLSHKWLITYSYVGRKEQAINVQRFVLNKTNEFEERS